MKRIEIKRRLAKIRALKRDLAFAEAQLENYTSSAFWLNRIMKIRRELTDI